MTWLEVGAVAVATFALTVVFTWLLIPFLQSRQLGKAIREDGPAHQAKAGTPTMGGLGMLAAVAIAGAYLAVRSAALVGSLPASRLDDHGWVITAGMVWSLVGAALFSILGLLDDWAGLAKKGRAREVGVGWSARQMFALQIAIAMVLAAVWVGIGDSLFRSAHLDDNFLAAGGPGDFRAYLGPLSPHLPGLVVVPAVVLLVGVLVIAGTVNGANFSDGLDGLAAGLLAFAFVGVALAAHQVIVPITNAGLAPSDPAAASGALPLIALAMSAAAACLGFLVFNRHPARVFMGNVASMGLGALLACIAVAGGIWYLLPIIGAVFLAEVVSDIIQVGYYKYSGGKRVFRMAPIHHHFEAGGWPETKVVRVFWFAGLVSAMVGVAAAAWLARA